MPREADATPDTAQSLIAYARENSRVCPEPGLWHKLRELLPDALDAARRKAKIHNLLSRLGRAGQIANVGSRAAPCWVLAQKSKEPEKSKPGINATDASD